MLHTSFPFLPNELFNLRKLLVQVPKTLRDGFFGAMLMVAMRSSASVPQADDHDHEGVKEALLVIASPEQTHFGTRNDLANILYLQMCVLMLMSCDMTGPSNFLPIDLPGRAVWSGLAVNAGQNLRLFHPVNDHSSCDDTEYSLGRRAFWALIALDRFYALSMGNFPQFQSAHTNIRPIERGALGASMFNIASK